MTVRLRAPCLRSAIALGAASASLAASAAATPLVGAYVATASEIAAGLRLTDDGRFDYALVYGALGERAKGRWREKDGKVLLTTEPAPSPAAFRVVSDTPSVDGKLRVMLDEPEALGGMTLTVRVFYPGVDQPEFVEVEDDGTVPLATGRIPAAIVPDVPVYEVPLEPHPLKSASRSLTFHFDENDLGVADFRDEPLAVQGDALVLRRYERTISFEKAED